MKKILLLASMVGVFTSNLLAGTVLTDAKVSELVKGNPILSSKEFQVKKAEAISDNLTALKLNVTMMTQKGPMEREAQGYVAKIDGKTYTFLGGAYGDKGEKVSVSMDKKAIEAGVLWSHGTGSEEIYLVTNPSCPWCTKFEEASSKDAEFLKKYKVNVLLMPFHEGAVEKAYWVLSAKTGAEKAERYKKVMLEGNEDWKKFTPTAEQKTALDAELAKSLAAAKELNAEGTPAVFNSKFETVNWPTLLNVKP